MPITLLETTDLLSDPLDSRTVKPRKAHKPCTLPIVAVTNEHALSEATGAIIPLAAYIENLPDMPRTIVVTFSAETLLFNLHERWESHPLWRWRVTSTTKQGRPLLRKRVAYYGFRDPQKKQNRYHIVIDAQTFFRRHDRTPASLLKLGQDIREFCNTWGLAVRPSAAGIATQLLKHPMFYPFERRRVPTFINETVRPHLPGGHYESYVDAGQRMDAVSYVDQEAAHHYAAMTTPLPSSNSVRATGYTRSDNRPWARKGGKLYERAMQSHGLIRAFVSVPPLEPSHYNSETGEAAKGQKRYVPRVMQTAGERVAHLWTNEIPYLEKMGLDIRHLIAVWGSEEVDSGIAKYAQWAKNVSKQHPELKAMLLMPYGLLARHPGEVIYHHPGGDEHLILANQYLDGTRTLKINTQPETANVLQLGLIQAFVRSLSLDLAQQADAEGHEVISVYADGIFVRLTDGKQLPIFAPWRVKEEYLELELTNSIRVPVRKRLTRNYVATEKR